MKRVRNLLIIITVLAVIVGATVIYGKRGGDPVAVKTVTVKRTEFVTKLPENGIVQRPQVATVPTLVSGNIGQIYVKPGERVYAGQLLATIENPSLQSNAAGSQADYNSAEANIETARIQEQNAKVTYQAQVETAKSNLAEARRVYDADAALYSSKAISRNQLLADKAKLDQAQVQYEQAVRQLRLGAVTGYGSNSVQYAQANADKMRIVNESNQEQLGFTRVTAPFSGVIETIATQSGDPLTNLRAGDPVTQGQSLFTIAASDAYIVKAQVDEQDIINVHPGQRANITGEDFPGVTLTGRVIDISPVAIRSTDASSTARQVLTTLRLDRSPPFLRDGMSVNVDVLTQDMRNALAIPNDAIVKDNGKAYVFVVRRGVAHKTLVHLGKANDTATIVQSGVQAGDTIVSQQVPGLVDNQLVKAS
jgi:RND family efflux transporter MFP subunit